MELVPQYGDVPTVIRLLVLRPIALRVISPPCQYSYVSILLYANTPLCQYSSVPMLLYANTPTCQYSFGSILLHADTPTRQHTYVSILLRSILVQSSSHKLELKHRKCVARNDLIYGIVYIKRP